MVLPSHDRYEEYTEEELRGFLAQSPRHADKAVVLFHIERLQKIKNDQKADERHVETRRRSNLAISIVGVIVSIGSLVLAYLANKPTPKRTPDTSRAAPSTSLPSFPPSLSPTPAPTDQATTAPSATPQPQEPPSLSPEL